MSDSPRFAFPDMVTLDQLASFPIFEWMHASHVRVEESLGSSLLVSADPMPAWAAEVARLAADAPLAWPPEADRGQPPQWPVILDMRCN